MTRNQVLVAILVAGTLAAPSRTSAADYHHVHITSASPLQAVDWYARHMGCEPVIDRSDANCYGVEVVFVPQTTTGGSQGTGVDHHRVFGGGSAGEDGRSTIKKRPSGSTS